MSPLSSGENILSRQAASAYSAHSCTKSVVGIPTLFHESSQILQLSHKLVYLDEGEEKASNQEKSKATLLLTLLISPKFEAELLTPSR
jgi:hypothetical protein